VKPSGTSGFFSSFLSSEYTAAGASSAARNSVGISKRRIGVSPCGESRRGAGTAPAVGRVIMFRRASQGKRTEFTGRPRRGGVFVSLCLDRFPAARSARRGQKGKRCESVAGPPL